MDTDSILTSFHARQLRLYMLTILVYLGIASLIVVPMIQRDRTNQTVNAQLSQYLHSTKSRGAVSEASIGGIPASISIKRLDINLPVAPGYYNLSTRKWTLDNKHVFTDNYTNTNPVVGTHQSRVTVIYGHDIPGVLVKTSQLTHGDIMTIDTQNGYRFRYYYDRSEVLVPTNTSILNEENTGDPVALVTCTGTWYQFRHAMFFRLIDVHKVPSQGTL